MKLKNKKTGEIIDLSEGFISDTFDGEKILIKSVAISDDKEGYVYSSLAELNEEWEDYEEPFSTQFYTIVNGEIKRCIFYSKRIAGCPSDAWAYFKDDGREKIKQLKEVGLYFETKEETERAVEKLKAWKRLRDKGIKIGKRMHSAYGGEMFWACPSGTGISDKQIWQDLDLLFGGEE